MGERGGGPPRGSGKDEKAEKVEGRERPPVGPKVLDKDESMTVQKHELFKACRQLDYHGDVRSLWHALDFDDSGVATLDEPGTQLPQPGGRAAEEGLSNSAGG
ncbi:unnamed protein product [Prorocentrum cordatum]|uniref:EF-hand domain-containing protein n=1 Tax=Prorocentrum cordatum TaxID=2364126 RepID=A0ABN9UTV4_9DINO|nr:unnamed protein product [Polarella glacialis]